jgi:thiol-disulfide isomerase/thioredoxin
MKHKINFLTILSSLVFASSFGQTKYIQSTDGKVIDTLTYASLKQEQIEKIKAVFPTKKVVLRDNFKEIKQTKDSVIYSYKWDIKVTDEKSSSDDEKSFDPDKYLDKLFKLPSLKSIDNKTITLESLVGKPTLINFWFTTCAPCIEEMPVLNKIRRQLKDSVNFVAITYEPTIKTIEFLKKHKFDFIQISNAKEFTDSMNMHAFPVNIFVDKNGIVRKVENGIPYIKNEDGKLKMGDGKEFEAALRDLL